MARTQVFGVVGAGISGLLCAEALSTFYPQIKVVLIGPEDNRCQHFSFWMNKNDDIQYDKSCVIASSSQWLLTDVQQSSETYNYITLDGLKYKTQLRKTLAARDNVRMIDSTVNHWQRTNSGFDISVDREILHVDKMFSSVGSSLDTVIKQQFVGIKFDLPIRLPTVLMDFDILQTGLFPRFIYAIPTLNGYLVELTTFSPHIDEMLDAEHVIVEWLSRKFGVTADQQVVEREQGCIPMGEIHYPDDDVFYIGTAGGAARPATGYAFLAILKEINNITQTAPGRPQKAQHFDRATLIMDKIFLRVLRLFPQKMHTVFAIISRALSADEFVRFMQDDANWKIRLKLILKLPKKEFCMALIE